MDINQLLSSLDMKQLQAQLSSLDQLMKTPEGRALRDRLSKIDTKELLHQLEGFERAKGISTDELLKRMGTDKQILKQINAFLDSQGK